MLLKSLEKDTVDLSEICGSLNEDGLAYFYIKFLKKKDIKTTKKYIFSLYSLK